MTKNDIEHITNEIVEFILTTFDETKENLYNPFMKCKTNLTK
jgi:hypothetical protein